MSTTLAPDAARHDAVLPVATGRQVRAAVATTARDEPALVAGAAAVLVVATVALLAVPRLLGALVDVVADGRAADLNPTSSPCWWPRSPRASSPASAWG